MQYVGLANSSNSFNSMVLVNTSWVTTGLEEMSVKIPR